MAFGVHCRVTANYCQELANQPSCCWTARTVFRHARAATTSTTEGARLASAAQRAAFSQALQRARKDAGLSQGALARRLHVSRSAVSQWELGLTAPRPDTATKLERLLQLEPGSLGRLLGQVPADAVKPGSVSVSEAIEADPRLGRRERDLLIAMYRQLVRQREAGAASGS